MIEITPTLLLDESEIQLDFVRASGPGGQNVNKVSTAAQLRWDVNATSVLAPEAKARLLKLAGSRVTEEGILIIEARRYRSQEQNRLDAIARLVALVQQALLDLRREDGRGAHVPAQLGGGGDFVYILAAGARGAHKVQLDLTLI